MSRPFPLVLAFCSALLAAGCGGSSGGGSAGVGQEELEALRHELFAAGILPSPPPPAVSDELFELGQALFFDKVLSGNEDVSCATCHLPDFFTGDGRTLPRGANGVGLGPHRDGGALVPRNSAPLFALHQKRELFWDGRVRDVDGIVLLPPDVPFTDQMRAVFSPGLGVLAAQALLPVVSREEMRGFPGENDLANVMDGYGSVWEVLIERLLDLPGYLQLLSAAYPGVALQDLTFAHAANAIAAFEVRAFARTDSPFDRFVRGDDDALTPAQVRGALVFFGEGCASCHSGTLLSDQDYHNIGLPQLGPGVDSTAAGWRPGSDFGRENATWLREDRFAFRTPTLLNVELTAPYGHAGQFAELRDFVAHYRDPVLSHLQYDIQANVSDPLIVNLLAPNSDEVLATLDPRLQTPNDFDVDAVVEFLRALTAEDAFTLAEIVPPSVPSGLPIF